MFLFSSFLSRSVKNVVKEDDGPMKKKLMKSMANLQVRQAKHSVFGREQILFSQTDTDRRMDYIFGAMQNLLMHARKSQQRKMRFNAFLMTLSCNRKFWYVPRMLPLR